MSNNMSRTNMKKSFYIVASLVLACILFVGCKKWIEEPDPKEDLSYLIKIYHSYESGVHIFKTTWTYDGYKPMGHQYYEDGQLSSEYKNYSYDGLNASWDCYNYFSSETIVEHVETEYLDDTFLRIKYQKTTEYSLSDPQSIFIYEIYYVYEGKKVVGFKRYQNGKLTREGHDFNYDGLHCTYQETRYPSSNSNFVSNERRYNIVYLDDTYLRVLTSTYTKEVVYDDGTSYTSTVFTSNDYNGKKPIGFQTFVDGELTEVERDYQYAGLTCHYFHGYFLDGELHSTSSHEVKFLE